MRTVDAQICHFLSATRKLDLAERKKDVKLSTKTGRKRRQHFFGADWEQVSNGLGFTSIISLLYRKRIQANYKDIETFICKHLDPKAAYKDLICIVSSLNLVHEAFILTALGDPEYKTLVQMASGAENTFVQDRLA